MSASDSRHWENSAREIQDREYRGGRGCGSRLERQPAQRKSTGPEDPCARCVDRFWTLAAASPGGVVHWELVEVLRGRHDALPARAIFVPVRSPSTPLGHHELAHGDVPCYNLKKLSRGRRHAEAAGGAADLLSDSYKQIGLVQNRRFERASRSSCAKKPLGGCFGPILRYAPAKSWLEGAAWHAGGFAWTKSER